MMPSTAPLDRFRGYAEIASWDAGRQLARARRSGVDVDEIALRIDDFHGYAVTRTEVFPESVLRPLSELNALFGAMARDDWEHAAVRLSPRWAASRVLAASVAEQMGDCYRLLPDEAWD
ncbi:hypothetical protein ACFVWN_09015 [Nocardiopsis flavescens]|uniref:hypothetical protein n=1 Tax=Nocardiopsis flavescens TaxID=758803 RepID=UPI00365AC9CC